MVFKTKLEQIITCPNFVVRRVFNGQAFNQIILNVILRIYVLYYLLYLMPCYIHICCSVFISP